MSRMKLPPSSPYYACEAADVGLGFAAHLRGERAANTNSLSHCFPVACGRIDILAHRCMSMSQPSSVSTMQQHLLIVANPTFNNIQRRWERLI